MFISQIFSQIESVTLDLNNFHVPVNAQGMLGFYDGEGGFADVPAGSNVAPFYVSTLWLGAKESITGNVMGCIPMYYTDYNPVQPGPVYFTALSSSDSILFSETYNRVWKISKEEIEFHKLHYSEPGYEMPEVILNWPGNGDTTKGITKILAPFTDYNSNEKYEPALGDHPNIKGDQAVYVICNVNSSDPDFPDSKMETEIHLMLYAYQEPETTILYNTVFLNYHIFNRSVVMNYDSLYMGQFVDFSLGCYNDDYVGSDSLLNLFYVYNGDIFDEPCSTGFSNTLPAVGCVALTDSLFSFMYLNGDFTALSLPDYPADGYYNLQGIFKDGTPITYGGDGYGGLERVHYMFPSDLHDGGGWTEITESNTPSERRVVGGIGPFQFHAEEDICFEYAFVFSQADIPDDNIASVDVLKDDVAQLHIQYPLLEEEHCLSYKTATLPPIDTSSASAFIIYPNPANENIIIQTNLMKDAILFARLYDAAGQLLNFFTLINETNYETHTIDTSNLPNGLYFLHFNYDGREFTEKVLIH